MAEDKTSILLSDISVEGDLVEKDKIILDAKISGDIKHRSSKLIQIQISREILNQKLLSWVEKLKEILIRTK